LILKDLMKRKSKSCLTPVIVTLLAGGCLLVLGGLWGLDMLPRLAAADFGNPAPGIERFQKAIYALQLVLQRDALIKPMDANGKAKTIEISQGESVNSIALDLENNGIIPDAGVFRLYLIYSGIDKSIQAGAHQLSPAQTALEIAQAIQDANPKEVSVRVLAGWREEEIAAALPINGLSISADEFLKTVSLLKGETILPGFPNLKSTEGYFLPDVYVFKREASPEEIIVNMLQNFDQQVTQEIRDGIKRHGLTLPEAVILASIVQKEAVMADEMPIIASVFYNRLGDGMKLDSDPTVQYALGYNAITKTWWKNPLNASDLKVNSPYNTYVNIGLPPGPICSPGLPALRAVAFPAQTPYYYFRARCDGSGKHNFATTYAEQINNACK
jgi:UPF0755 protein